MNLTPISNTKLEKATPNFTSEYLKFWGGGAYLRPHISPYFKILYDTLLEPC